MKVHDLLEAEDPLYDRLQAVIKALKRICETELAPGVYAKFVLTSFLELIPIFPSEEDYDEDIEALANRKLLSLGPRLMPPGIFTGWQLSGMPAVAYFNSQYVHATFDTGFLTSLDRTLLTTGRVGTWLATHSWAANQTGTKIDEYLIADYINGHLSPDIRIGGWNAQRKLT